MAGFADPDDPAFAAGLSQPQEDSPYYPSSRRWLNPLLVALDGPSPAANDAGGLIDGARRTCAGRMSAPAFFRREGAR